MSDFEEKGAVNAVVRLVAAAATGAKDTEGPFSP
jgi:hypothetical protein